MRRSGIATTLNRALWHLVTQNRRLLLREQRALLSPPDAPKDVLEIGSGQQRRGRHFQSAVRFRAPATRFTMSDVNPFLGHLVLDVTAPEPGLNRFDLVLCCNVLEHVADLRAAVDGLSRLCSEDGLVFASTPFVYPYHDEPDDFWRPTSHGLRSLFEERFEEVRVSWTGIRRFPFQVFVHAQRPRS